MKSIIVTVASLVSLLIAFFLGKTGQKEKESLRGQVAQSEARAESLSVETASARMAAEVVSDLSKAESERLSAAATISRLMAEAKTDEDVFAIARILSDRAAERIKRNTR